jgi:hypothetical protein
MIETAKINAHTQYRADAKPEKYMSERVLLSRRKTWQRLIFPMYFGQPHSGFIHSMDCQFNHFCYASRILQQDPS